MPTTCQPSQFTKSSPSAQLNVPSDEDEVFVNPSHLVLDLDHTLISSFEFGESPVPRKAGENVVSPILSDDYKDELGLPQMYHATISNVVVLIKLRPFVRSFIRSAATLGLTLHVYTKGRRAYMNEVIRLIDPEGHIKGRRISRDDEPGHVRETQKEMLLIDPVMFPNRGSSFIVLDDSPSVWAAACSAGIELIAASRYTFSDKFVTFLRSMEKGALCNYPRDGDSFLVELGESLCRRFPPLPPSVEASSSVSEDEETLTPVNDSWEEKVPVIAELKSVVLRVARNRFV